MYTKSLMSSEERKILCKPPISILDYLGSSDFGTLS